MNSDESRQAELDARLRRLHGGLDAGAGFEERVMRRIATVVATLPRENLRAQVNPAARRQGQPALHA